jgi:L-gulono-1,4-lactone dehydrogenase
VSVWTNWAGQQRCAPSVIERPATEEQLCDLVARHASAGRTIRAVGSGHSFTDIALTDDVMVDLSRLHRPLTVDPVTGVVRAGAGMTLHDLAGQLHQHGLALENQGDIDAQTVAGALSTGTHGTGARFGNLSSRVTGGRLVTATGDVVELAGDPDPDLLPAARVSLGALGVLTEVELRAVPAFRVHKVEEVLPLRDVLDTLDERVAEHDHVEVYAFPWSTRALLLTSRRTDEPARPIGPIRQWVTDELLNNTGLGALQRIGRRFPAAVPAIGRLIGHLASGSERLDDSWRVYASSRRVRFTEMEHALPRTALREVLERTLWLIERRNLPVNFPIEIRFTAADDALLSTAHDRATAYLAVHQFIGMEYETYFRAVEAIASEHGARPHWGKRHYLTAAQLAPRYPAWQRFAAARRRLDPGGVFTNAYVERVLGPAAEGMQ